MFKKTKNTTFASVVSLFTLLWGTMASAQETDGFKYNNLTVSPFVNLGYTYDSNVNYDQNETDDQFYTINPGVDLTYTGNDWGLAGSAWFARDTYQEYDELDADRYGQNLEFYRESAKGWRLVLGESYTHSRENDSILDGGNGIWRERDLFELNGALAYQFSEKTGATLSGSYSDLNYKNDLNQYGSLYGWREWSTGLELARKLSEKSNVLLSGNLNQYDSKGAINGTASSSTGYSLMGGFGSRATERISYRILTGAQWFNYADSDMLTGWTYSLDANWIISKKLVASVAGSSYFQPSETQANQAMQVYALSSGLSYRPIRRLTLRCDLAYRREENQYNDIGINMDSTDDMISARLRADYKLMRYVSLYGGVELDDRTSDDETAEYDRQRLILGLQFRY